MSLFIYRRQRSTGALDLARELGGTRLRELNGVRTVQPGDALVCWGEQVTPGYGVPRVRILNGAPLRNKFQDALALRAAGVNTIEVSQRRPAPIPTGPAHADPALLLWEEAKDLTEAFDGLTFTRSPIMTRSMQELSDLFTRLATSLHAPLPVAPLATPGDWVGRDYNHMGGTDLLHPPVTPDYFSKKENLVEEYRVHSFNGRSIRAGRKVTREGYHLTGPNTVVPQPPNGPAMTRPAHPWVRSYDGGWRVVYDNFESTRTMRDLAHAAVAALGLQFGAVDLGQRADGTLLVLEVNRAPGLEGGTVTTYANAIRTWEQETRS